MTTATAGSTTFRGAGSWLWLSIVGALLAMIGNVIALSIPRIYSGLTPAFLPQALAQDIADLLLVGPAWLTLAFMALRGSARAYLLWLGILVFTVYNYIIYAFSVPFGPLFLLWVGVLGLSLYSLIGGIAAADHRAVQSSYGSPRAIAVTAWFLLVTAVLFAFLWLSEDVPALLLGARPQSVIDLALPTNPVHVLDLSFFLPAVMATGVMLLRKRPLAFTVAPSFMIFLILTGLPILLTPVVQAARGQAAAWGVFAPIGTLTLLLLGLLIWLLSTIAPRV